MSDNPPEKPLSLSPHLVLPGGNERSFGEFEVFSEGFKRLWGAKIVSLSPNKVLLSADEISLPLNEVLFPSNEISFTPDKVSFSSNDVSLSPNEIPFASNDYIFGRKNNREVLKNWGLHLVLCFSVACITFLPLLSYMHVQILNINKLNLSAYAKTKNFGCGK